MRKFFLAFIAWCTFSVIVAFCLIPCSSASESVPVVVTGSTSGVSGQSAVLNGTVNPGSNLTMYYFQYGSGTGYGKTTELKSAGLGADAVSVSETITGLMEGASYHFRLVAFSINGVVNGSDVVFSTCKIKMSGLSISGTRVVNRPVSFSISAQDSGDSDLNYRFSMHPDYGTDEYDGTQWSLMTDTEWVSTNAIDYAFSSAGRYIVVVWISDTHIGVNATGIPIIGFSIEILESASVAQSSGVDISSCSISGIQEVQSPVTLSVSTLADSDETVYYRFSMHPDYGTDRYDGTNWSSMTDTEWVSTNAIDYTFSSAGRYVVVVWMTRDTDNVDPTGIPIAGFSINVDQTGEEPFF